MVTAVITAVGIGSRSLRSGPAPKAPAAPRPSRCDHSTARRRHGPRRRLYRSSTPRHLQRQQVAPHVRTRAPLGVPALRRSSRCCSPPLPAARAGSSRPCSPAWCCWRCSAAACSAGGAGLPQPPAVRLGGRGGGGRRRRAAGTATGPSSSARRRAVRRLAARRGRRAVGRCDAVCVVIGPDWTTSRDGSGRRRLMNVRDPVRVEVETALHSGRATVPVLVGGAVAPRADDLPETMRGLVGHPPVTVPPARTARGTRICSPGWSRRPGPPGGATAFCSWAWWSRWRRLRDRAGARPPRASGTSTSPRWPRTACASWRSCAAGCGRRPRCGSGTA